MEGEMSETLGAEQSLGEVAGYSVFFDALRKKFYATHKSNASEVESASFNGIVRKINNIVKAGSLLAEPKIPAKVYRYSGYKYAPLLSTGRYRLHPRTRVISRIECIDDKGKTSWHFLNELYESNEELISKLNANGEAQLELHRQLDELAKNSRILRQDFKSLSSTLNKR